jgi:hypothetical protein
MWVWLQYGPINLNGAYWNGFFGCSSSSEAPAGSYLRAQKATITKKIQKMKITEMPWGGGSLPFLFRWKVMVSLSLWDTVRSLGPSDSSRAPGRSKQSTAPWRRKCVNHQPLNLPANSGHNPVAGMLYSWQACAKNTHPKATKV